MDPFMTWGLLLLGMFIGASPAFILGAAITRRKMEIENDNAARLTERIEKGWSDR
jgi:membrane protein DedA with SNARE-associated domain